MGKTEGTRACTFNSGTPPHHLTRSGQETRDLGPGEIQPAAEKSPAKPESWPPYGMAQPEPLTVHMMASQGCTVNHWDRADPQTFKERH